MCRAAIKYICYSFLFLQLSIFSGDLCAQDVTTSKYVTRYFNTADGVEFGLWGGNGETEPAPTLFILSGTIDEALGDDYFKQCGTALATQNGWLCVSLDLPGHGKLKTSANETGLASWASAVRRKEDFVAASNARMQDVLAYLIQNNYTDTSRIFVAGTSRGGYLALQFAAFEKRVKAVAAFAPVTDLLALKEFNGITSGDLPGFILLDKHLQALARKSVWIAIGDRDTRVNTGEVIRFAGSLSKTILQYNAPGSIELNILPEPRGHTTPAGAVGRAIAWFRTHAPQHKTWDSTARPDIFSSRVELFRSLPHSEKDIVFLGNSITFWGDWNTLFKSPHVKNRGIPGDITFGVLERLDEVIEGRPAKLFVLIGINDLARNIPDSVIINNYYRIVDRVKNGSPRTKIFFQTLLPTNDILHKKTSIYNNNSRILDINIAIRKLAAGSNAVNVIDLHPEFVDGTGKLNPSLTWDGIHLNLAGYEKWSGILKQGKYLE